jgi:tripartite-type tricarboxylate transporter receptor subunit TctC
MTRESCSLSLLLRVIVAGVLATAWTGTPAQNDYPTRTIRIIVPLPPGPFADALPRIIAVKLSARWGHAVIVENRPGASQNLGAEVVAKAEPDGHTLLATPSGPLVTSQHLFPKLGFDPAAFVPVTVTTTMPYMLVANPRVPAATVKELIALAKTHPQKITYASPGTGSPPHLTAEMLRSAAGIRMVHVPYKGQGPAMNDLLGGHVDLLVDNLANTLPHIRDGKLKALGVASEERIPELPGVPALAETYPGVVNTAWYAIVAPPKTPPEIAAKLSTAVAETLKLADVMNRLRDFAATPVGNSPAEAAAFFKQESERWRRVIAANGIKLE